jgi:RNA polymerase sigma-70 factor (ECF subfamily)
VASWAADSADTISRAQRGDQEAFDAIYARFADPLYRYLYARVGDGAIAEELFGELWLRVVERLGAFRPPASGAEHAFAAWLYRIAHNLAVDSLRRRGGLPLDAEIVSREPGPDEQVIGGEERTTLRDALAQLTPDQREVVVMRFYEERSSAEVAALTGRSEGAVKVMQHRALHALARLLGVERGGKRRS